MSLLFYVYSLYGIWACGALAIMEPREIEFATNILAAMGSAILIGWLGSRLAASTWSRAELAGVMVVGALGLLMFYSWYSGVPSDWRDRVGGFGNVWKINVFVDAQCSLFETTASLTGTVTSWKILGGRAQQAQAAAQQRWIVPRRIASVLLYTVGFGASLFMGLGLLVALSSIIVGISKLDFDMLWDGLRPLNYFLMLPTVLFLAGMWLSPSKNRRVEGFSVAAAALALSGLFVFLIASSGYLVPH